MAGFGFALNPARAPGPGATTGLAARLQALREAIGARIAAVLPVRAGRHRRHADDRRHLGIPEADRAAFRDSGLAHLLAIAGLHIGIVMAWSFASVRLGFALSEHAALHWPLKAIAALAALPWAASTCC